MSHLHFSTHTKNLLFAASLVVGCHREQQTSVSPATTTPVAEPATVAPNPFDVDTVMERAKGVFGVLPNVMPSAEHGSTPARVALGRQLYFEKRLSKNQQLSCNSCHDLGAYGVDVRTPGAKTSSGHKGQLGGRNSPTAYNAAMHIAQFWDGRAPDVEAQAKGPILNPVEMALPGADRAVQILKSIPGYKPLFAEAFPAEADPITYDNVGLAIGAFERGLVTPGRFDRFLSGDKSALAPEEVHGLVTFMDSGCTACHNGAAVGGGMYQKLGLMKPYPTPDEGRFEVTKNSPDKGVFKVPSLRNIAKTAPYFHDGSQPTLEAAVTTMAEYQTAKGQLSDVELKSIVTFLKSLTGALPTEYIKAVAELPGSKSTPKPNPS
jgi:cytochrome c peroxidase